MDKFLIIDGNSIICRAAFASSILSNSMGRETGGTYRFIAMLDKAMKVIQPTHVVVAFDIEGSNFRKNIDKNYKSNREKMSFSAKIQNEDVKTILSLIGIKYVSLEGYEADDIVGTYVSKSKADKNFVLSGDRDLFQLIDEKTSVIYPEVGMSKFKTFDLEAFKAEYGIEINQYIYLKSLIGDDSDNIKGVSGCGLKTASKLLKKYNDIDTIIKNKNNLTAKLKENFSEWQPYFDKALSIFTIVRDLDVPYSYDDCKIELFWEKAESIFNELEFYSFIKKMKGGKFYNVDKQ